MLEGSVKWLSETCGSNSFGRQWAAGRQPPGGYNVYNYMAFLHFTYPYPDYFVTAGAPTLLGHCSHHVPQAVVMRQHTMPLFWRMLHRAATSCTRQAARSKVQAVRTLSLEPVLSRHVSRRLVLQLRSPSSPLRGPAPCTSRTQPLAPGGPKPQPHNIQCHVVSPPTRASRGALPMIPSVRAAAPTFLSSPLPAHTSCLAPSTSLLLAHSQPQRQPSPHPSRWS